MSTPGSFTKNFGFGTGFQGFAKCIELGFGGKPQHVNRQDWIEAVSGTLKARHLVPLNYFLYSRHDDRRGDFVLLDEFASQCLRKPLNAEFGRIALFTFHLAMSGSWSRSKWPDGRVAVWANEFIRSVAWIDGKWTSSTFEDAALMSFFDRNIVGVPVSRRKMFTNYRYLLNLTGVVESVRDGVIDLNPQKWGGMACRILWDRLAYRAALLERPTVDQLMAAFLEHEAYKLLGCSKDFGLSVAARAADDYIRDGGVRRFGAG